MAITGIFATTGRGKRRSRRFVQVGTCPTIFHEDWWLDAATNGQYEVAEVASGGSVFGRLPYRMTSRFGMKWCTAPELTYFLGPAVDEGTGNVYTRFMRKLEITRDLIRKLRLRDRLRQCRESSRRLRARLLRP